MIIDRRSFLKGITVLGLTGLTDPHTLAIAKPIAELPRFSVRTLTQGPKNHFFGYYGMSPWNSSGTQMVCLEPEFHHRLPESHEEASIGLVDPVFLPQVEPKGK